MFTKLSYVFPEPLPLPRARGLQTVNTVVALADAGMQVDLIHVPAGNDPVAHYGLTAPPNLHLKTVSRSLAWPLQRIHSNRLFFHRLGTVLNMRTDLIFVRHLKLAAMLADSQERPAFIYEAHEVFSDTAAPAQSPKRFEEESRVMRGARALVTNSAATAKRLTKLHGASRPIEVIPNGVVMPELPQEKNWTEAHRRIIYSGSLFPWKGVTELVAAAARMGREYHIDIVGGEGERLAQVRQSAGEAGAALQFHGHQTHGRVMQMLNDACIAVLPNRRETDSEFTSPIKLFEYMAAGCAIVTSDLPSIREILDEEDALWCMPGDPASIATAIQKLASDPVLAKSMGARVREKSRTYTWSARATRLKRLIEALPAG